MASHRVDEESLQGSLRDFLRLEGADILERVSALHDWLNVRRKNKVWTYSKIIHSRPGEKIHYSDEFGEGLNHGTNFAIQDYLSLSSHPKIHEAAKSIIDKFGPHSAGSPILVGNSELSKRVERRIADTFEGETSILYPTGWMAGFGIIQGLIRPNDHIVIDKLAHACLATGTYHATKNINKYSHNDTKDLIKILKQIRSTDTSNGILVITEGLFSMDSDIAPIKTIQDICHQHNATLLVDVAHDFGGMGPKGTGSIGIQNMIGKVDLVMGAFSKTFACNGGFIVCSRKVRDYLSVFSSSFTFSNAISPIQIAIVDRCLDIIQSAEGDKLRAKLMKNILHLRKNFIEAGFSVFGEPSPIVPVFVGNEKLARVTSRYLNESSLLANLVEFPAVPVGLARFRFQVMASHALDECDRATKTFSECYQKARLLTQGFEKDEKNIGRTIGMEQLA